MIDLCRERGLIIESDAQEASKTGLSLLEYQSQQAEDKLQDTIRQQVFAEIERDSAEQRATEASKKAQEASRQAQEALEHRLREEHRLEDLKVITGKVGELKSMYRDMMNDLASSWKDILQAQSIAVNHIPEVRKQEISRGFGKKETVYTVSESDAYNIQALYKRVTAERIYNIDKVLQQLPKITKAVNTL